MNLVRTRLNQEWQDLDITYPEWLTRVVLDEAYYTATMILACAVCFVVGMIIGIVWTVI